jgi:hypothetical protein
VDSRIDLTLNRDFRKQIKHGDYDHLERSILKQESKGPIVTGQLYNYTNNTFGNQQTSLTFITNMDSTTNSTNAMYISPNTGKTCCNCGKDISRIPWANGFCKECEKESGRLVTRRIPWE